MTIDSDRAVTQFLARMHKENAAWYVEHGMPGAARRSQARADKAVHTLTRYSRPAG